MCYLKEPLFGVLLTQNLLVFLLKFQKLMANWLAVKHFQRQINLPAVVVSHPDRNQLKSAGDKAV